ncbi:MAG: DNA methyltransferase [Candidatus Micrarchaeota archaeon]
MLIDFVWKKSGINVLPSIAPVQLRHAGGEAGANSKLIKGDNLAILKYLSEYGGLKGKVDLVYIDPPFATNNVFRIGVGRANSISHSKSDRIAYDDSLNGMEYLEFLRERLVLLKQLLSDRGSIYVHIDYKIGHYVKIVMDDVFGEQNYINEITRIKCNPKNFSRVGFGNIKDMVLFYSKTGDPIWNEPREQMGRQQMDRLFKKIGADGRRYTTVPLHAPGETANGETGQAWRGLRPPKGRHWRSPPSELERLDKAGLIEWSKNGVPRKKIYADENGGKKVQDVLEYKDPQNPSYPTEKNIDLLKLFVKGSSNPDSIILDCFCGSGTTLKAAQELGRSWIGIDQSDEAIRIALQKLGKGQSTLHASAAFDYLEAIPKSDKLTTEHSQLSSADNRSKRITKTSHTLRFD